jgi:pyridoxamine 5'-phosphate oxidase
MLSNLLNDSKKQLSSALKHKKHPFRYFTMTTIGEDGSPHSRTVVLRGFNSDQFTLTIYTDSRSNKFKELSNDPRAEFLFYDSNQLLQLVIKVNLIDSKISQKTFAELPEPMKKDYSSSLRPGTPIGGPDQVEYNYDKGHFTALTFEALQLEYLKLKRPNHLRARFLSKENWQGVFLTP